jgi:hypothetical protein
MAYNVVIEENALEDIQQAIDYYDEQLIGLGEKFENAIHKNIIRILAVFHTSRNLNLVKKRL